MISTRAKLTFSLTLVSMVLGFMISLQYRQQLQARSVVGYAAADTEQKKLVQQLNALKETNANAEKQLQDITSKISAYEKQSAGSNTSLQEMKQGLEDERILAGISAVQGPGVRITLMDGTPTAGADQEDFLTHDWDVRSVINELFTAGAEAVSINGYRVVATSGVFCTGPVVKVNDHRIGAPFTIEAIGDAPTLKSALNMAGGIVENLRQRGVKVSDPEIVQNLKMPPFTGTATAGDTP